MSRVKLLMDVVNDMEALTESLRTLAIAVGTDELEEKDAKAKEAAVVPVKEPDKTYTLEEVRQVLSAKSGAGFTAEVKALLERHGGSKLSQLDPAEYAAVMEEVKEIGGN